MGGAVYGADGGGRAGSGRRLDGQSGLLACGAAYGDIPPEVYEERTIQTLLRKLNVAVTGSGLRAKLRSRYGWIPAAVR